MRSVILLRQQYHGVPSRLTSPRDSSESGIWELKLVGHRLLSWFPWHPSCLQGALLPPSGQSVRLPVSRSGVGRLQMCELQVSLPSREAAGMGQRHEVRAARVFLVVYHSKRKEIT